MDQNQVEKISCHLHFQFFFSNMSHWTLKDISLSVVTSSLEVTVGIMDLGLFSSTEKETAFWINTCIISWE